MEEWGGPPDARRGIKEGSIQMLFSPRSSQVGGEPKAALEGAGGEGGKRLRRAGLGATAIGGSKEDSWWKEKKEEESPTGGKMVRSGGRGGRGREGLTLRIPAPSSVGR